MTERIRVVTDAQNAQTELIRKKRELELAVEDRVQDGLGEARSLAQRQEQIERVMGTTVGKFGNLQGISG